MTTARRASIAGLGDRIRCRRMLSGWSQADLAAEITEQGGRLTSTEISAYETGAKTPGVLAVLLIANAMDCTMDLLVKGDG